VILRFFAHQGDTLLDGVMFGMEELTAGRTSPRQISPILVQGWGVDPTVKNLPNFWNINAS